MPADDREGRADERERRADEREQRAHDRELLADERERLLDERQRRVRDHQDWEDIREGLADERELELEHRASHRARHQDRSSLPRDLTWTTAATLSQLGELTARWLTGRLAAHPCCAGRPDPGTRQLRKLLAAVNRRGLVTDFGQPGLSRRRDGWLQRAAVTGYCIEDTCRELADALATTELVVLTDRSPGSTRIPVTLQDGMPHTRIGGKPDAGGWAGGISDTGLTTLSTSWYVSVFDPVWGRNDHLWPALAACLRLPAPLAVAACASIG